MPTLDQQAKQHLNGWPLATTVFSDPLAEPRWLRAQPKDGSTTGPRIIAAGSDLFRTQPDGLWVALGSGCAYAFAVEASGSLQNFHDKRARYQPRTSALLVRLSGRWLRGRVDRQNGGTRARWQVLGLPVEPASDLERPIRAFRVLYALKAAHYFKAFKQVPLESHEFMARISDLRRWNAPPLQRVLKRASIWSSYLSPNPRPA